MSVCSTSTLRFSSTWTVLHRLLLRWLDVMSILRRSRNIIAVELDQAARLIAEDSLRLCAILIGTSFCFFPGVWDTANQETSIGGTQGLRRCSAVLSRRASLVSLAQQYSHGMVLQPQGAQS